MGKLMKPKVQWLDRTLVNSPHYLTLCTTPQLFKAALKDLGIAKEHRPDFVKNWHSSATAHYFENHEDMKLTVIVCIRGYEDKSPSQIAALICHEAVHVWQQIRQALGEDNPSPEFEAYSIQSIMQSLLEEFYHQTTC